MHYIPVFSPCYMPAILLEVSPNNSARWQKQYSIQLNTSKKCKMQKSTHDNEGGVG
jgi:hypothetical protein